MTEDLKAIPPPTRPFNWGALIAIAIVLGGVWAIFSLIQHQKALASAVVPPTKPSPVLSVTVKRAALQTTHRTLGVTGTIYARDEMAVGSEAVGLRIDQVLAEEGDYVSQGQVLAVLDSSVMQAQLAQEEARLVGAQASVQKTLQPNRPEDIHGLEAAVSQAQATIETQRANLLQAQATLSNDESNAQRYRGLLQQGMVTVADAQNVFTQAARDRALVSSAQDQVRGAQQAAEQARSRLRLAQMGGHPQDVQVAQAQAQQSRALIQQLQAQIAQTRILAPDDGLISKRDAHLGDITSGSKPLFTMVRRSQLEMRAQVPEAEIPRLKLHDPVTVSGYGKKVTGHIWLITPQVDAATRLGTARVSLPIRSGFLPGMFVSGTILEGAQQALMVPTRAVLGGNEQHYLFIYDNGTARRRLVTTGVQSGDSIEVTSGVHVDDAVIDGGAAFLNDGDLVSLEP